MNWQFCKPIFCFWVVETYFLAILHFYLIWGNKEGNKNTVLPLCSVLVFCSKTNEIKDIIRLKYLIDAS